MKKMKVSISKDGTMRHEMFGYNGSECFRASDAVFDEMGKKGITVVESEISTKSEEQRETERERELN